MLRFTGAASAALLALTGCAAADEDPCPLQTQSVDELIEGARAIVLADALGGTERLPAEGEEAGEIDLRDIQDDARKNDAGTGPEPADAAAGPNTDGDDRTTAGRLPVQLFQVVEYLKGDGAAQVNVMLSAPAEARTPPDHGDEAFLQDPRAGRASLTQDCRVEAGFEPGARYLLFFDEPHIKGYERIDSEDDPWLAHVKSALGAD